MLYFQHCGDAGVSPQLPFEADYSLIVGAGQSNLQGDQCAWAGAAPSMFGNAMLGLGTRPIVSQLSNPGVDLFEPVGGSNTITPLVSVNQDNVNGTAVTVNEGGFSGVTGAVFAFQPDSTLTLTAPTGTMVKLVNSTLVSTAVGGPGQPAFDLTQIFAKGMGVWVTGVTGGASAENINTIPTLRLAAVTPTQLTMTASQGFGYAGTSGTPINIAVTNNFGAFGEDPCVTQANDYAALAKKAGVLPAGKSFAVLNTAIAGATVASLAPGASPDLYNRAIDGVTRFVGAAAALGQTAYVSIDIYEQGAADSDPAVSAEVFSYVAFSGQPPSENIPAFTDTVLTGKTFPSPVGQPYALFNPCCVFNIGVPEDA